MLTNFLQQNNKNLISNYINFKKEDNIRTEKIKNEQDKIISFFVSSLVNTIYKNIKLQNKKEININLPIKNTLWYLWNTTWFLGQNHAIEEINTNFISSDLVTFNEEDVVVGANKRIENIRKLKQRREEESRITREVGIDPVQQSEFGQKYLSKRLSLIGDDLASSYKNGLISSGAMDRYFKSKNPGKDNILLKEIEGMVQKENLKKTIKENKQLNAEIKLNVLNAELKTKKITKQEYIAQEEIKIYDNPNLTDEQKEKLINKLNRTKYDPIINLSSGIKEELGLNPDKDYTVSELNKIRDKLKKEIKETKNTSGKAIRVALTEVGHAYNLGRLSEYEKRDIELLKLNNSVEHLRSSYPPKYVDIYKKQADNIGFPFRMQGIVCPICQERADRDNGYGKGIYLLSEVLSDRSLQLVFHPFCGCYYTPVEETDDEKRRRKRKEEVEIKVKSFFDNNIAKWAAGGAIATTALLGTAAMYAAFRKYKTNNLKTISKPKNKNQEFINKVKDLISENKDVISSSIEQELQTIRIPLKIKEYPEEILELTEEQKQQSERLLEVKTDYDADTVKNNINKNINQAREEINLANSNNPEIDINAESEIQKIINRLNSYSEYNKRNLTARERAYVINQYNKDLSLLNKTINNIESSNITLYSKMQSLYKAKEEALDVLKKSNIDIPENINQNIYLNNLPSIREINNTITDIENTLRQNINLINNKYTMNLGDLKYQMESNPDLLESYLNRSKRTINKYFDQLPNSLGSIPNELNSLDEIISNTKNITDDRYRQLLLELEVINFQLDKRLKDFKYNFDDIDLDFLSALVVDFEPEVLSKAQGLKAYKELLIETQKELFKITNKLINKKK